MTRVIPLPVPHARGAAGRGGTGKSLSLEHCALGTAGASAAVGEGTAASVLARAALHHRRWKAWWRLCMHWGAAVGLAAVVRCV